MLLFFLLPFLTDALTPVVIIPGDGASALEAKLDKDSAPHWYCSTQSDWFRLWLDPAQLASGFVDCWSENIMLHYNKSLDEVSDAPGVVVRVVGGLDGLTLDDSYLTSSASNVFSDLLDAFVDAGYVRDETLVGLPYDFRRAPTGNPDFITQIQSTIENVTAAQGEKVVILSHSLGGLNSLYFLNAMTDEWKNTYIAAWIPISPAYGGAVVDLIQFTSGSNEGIPWLSGLDVRDEQRSYESNVWLLPSPVLWGDDEPLVTTPSKNYSAHEYRALFDAVGFTDGPYLLNRVENLTSSFTDPGVPTFPMYGTDVDTPARYDYADDGSTWYNSQSYDTVMLSDGDGTVPLRSLAAGDNWNSASAPFVISGADHSGILSDETLIAQVLKVVAES